MMKKSKIFITLALVVASGFLGVLASTSNVEAANNECSAGYTKATYMDKIKYSYNGNVVTITGASGLNYTTNMTNGVISGDADGAGGHQLHQHIARRRASDPV